MRHPALLLLGPTGAGKSPLGDALEARGLRGRRCLHFDFGACLRRGASDDGAGGLLTPDERAFLRDVLRSGALLEDRDFPIARKILLDFLARRGAAAGDLLVLNGLPRHAGQAEALEPVVRVETVVHLACAPETVLERIRTDAGGDRAGRTDDALDDVRRKLATYEARTAPLLRHYEMRGVRVVTVAVGSRDAAETIRSELEGRLA